MFRTSLNKGFTITFDNGWTVSVQFGPGNYCQNRDKPMSFYRSKDHEDAESIDAEIAAWPEASRNDKTKKPCTDWHVFDTYEDGYEEHVKGWVKANEVLEFLNEIANKPKWES